MDARLAKKVLELDQMGESGDVCQIRFFFASCTPCSVEVGLYGTAWPVLLYFSSNADTIGVDLYNRVDGECDNSDQGAPGVETMAQTQASRQCL